MTELQFHKLAQYFELLGREEDTPIKMWPMRGLYGTYFQVPLELKKAALVVMKRIHVNLERVVPKHASFCCSEVIGEDARHGGGYLIYAGVIRVQ